MDAFQDGNGHDALSLIQQNVVDCCNCENHPIRKRKHCRWVVVLPLFQLIEIWAESNASSVRFDARKHKSWFVNLGFEESVHCVLKVGGVGRR